MAVAELTRVDATHFRFEVLAQRSDVANGPYFTVAQPVALDAELLSMMGLQSMVIQPGKYPVDYSNQQHGSILLDAVSR